MPENEPQEKSYFDRHKKLHEESRADFLEGKTKLSYYMLSLPFALASVAIASFPYPKHWALIVIEIPAWLLLLGAGACGLVAKRAEVERYRLRSLTSGAVIERTQSARERTSADAKLSLDREHKIMNAENREAKAEGWHWRLLVAGGVTWVVSRTVIAIFSAGFFGASGL